MSDAAFQSPTGQPRVAPVKDPQRSRITNGSTFPCRVLRMTVVLRFGAREDVIAAHLSDLGGPDDASAAERSLIRRVGDLTAELEHLEVRFATAGEANAGRIRPVSAHSKQLYAACSKTVQLQRRHRDVTPDRCRLSQARGRRGRVKPRTTLRKALADPQLLGGALAGLSWRAWRVLLIAAMGEELDRRRARALSAS